MPSNEININGRKIGRNQPPFIIAEMSGNHNQSLDRALEIVAAAALAGADALKIQTYTPDTMTLDCEGENFYISDPQSLWQGKSLYQLYQEASTPWEWHKPIFDRARELGLIPLSTPFDETSVDFLEDLGVPFYKIASFENTDLDLIRKVATTGKPIIISTGMATLAELSETTTILRQSECEFLLLKCTSSYPATPDSSNLLTIPHMSDLFNCQIGLSDHTLGIGVAIASVALGATLIEKHFTLKRSDGGVDSAFSLEPDEMKQLVIETRQAWQGLGHIQYGPTESEKKSLQYRRSVFIARDVNKGDLLTPGNLKVIRPGAGLQPKYYQMLLGKQTNRSLKKGTPMKWEYIG